MDYWHLGRVLKPVGRDNPSADKIEDRRKAQDEEEGTVPALVITDGKTGCVFAGAVAKGVNAYALHLATQEDKRSSCWLIQSIPSEHWLKQQPRNGEKSANYK